MQTNNSVTNDPNQWIVSRKWKNVKYNQSIPRGQ